MKITNVDVKRYKDMSSPSDMAIADGHEIIVVNIETDVGVTGTSFVGSPVFSHGEVGDVVVRLIERNLTNIILGENPMYTEHLWMKMYEAPWRIGMRGMIMDCIAAIDFALWDIKGKLLNVPVSDLFGSHRKHVPTYANVGQQLAPDEMGKQAAKYVEAGHTAVKIRAGLVAIPLDEATQRVAAVREAIGPDIKLLVDINASWDVNTAIDMLKKWRKYDIYWLEEPVRPEEVEGYKKIKQNAGDTYIVGGEQLSKFNDFRYLIEKDGVDMVQPNAAATGGITSWLKIYNYATSLDIPVSPWNLQQVHIPLAAGLPNVKWIEYFTPDRDTFQNTLLKGPLFEEVKLEDGIYLKASDALGFGIELNEEVAERTLVK